jgi:hypothetical protein
MSFVTFWLDSGSGCLQPHTEAIHVVLGTAGVYCNVYGVGWFFCDDTP